MILRKFGSRFNANNSLPDFSPMVQAKLNAHAEIPSNKYVSEIKHHIVKVLGKDIKIESKDYDMVCEAVVKRYPFLGDADNPSNFVREKRS